jgi:hypothetical protein
VRIAFAARLNLCEEIRRMITRGRVSALARLFELVCILAIALNIGLSQALACGSDNYDHNQELQAIRKGLSNVRLTAQDRSEVERLLQIASVNRDSLTMRGFVLQSDARGKALKKLGIERVPAKPAQEFEVLRLKLASVPHNEEGQNLLRMAEVLWSEHRYEEAREALEKAMKLLNVKIIYFRC